MPVSNRRLQHWLKAYMSYTSIYEAPDKMHFWVGVSTIAGALRRRVWINQGDFDWTPNFYIILVAPPGVVNKTTTLNTGIRLLRELDGIHFGPDVITWQELTRTFTEATELVEIEPGTFYPMSCITVASGELGNFFNPHDREMVDVLISLWDGQLGVWEKRTKTQGSDRIENPWLNIAACTTPAWIAGNFPEYLIGGGLTSRIIFIYADRKRKLVAYPATSITPEREQLRLDLVHDLEAISLLKGAYVLSKEALAWGESWYAEHDRVRPQHLDNEKFAGYISRKQTHIHKLAMVLSASYKDELLISTNDLSTAAEIVTSLEAEMPQVFELIGVQGGAKFSRELLNVVKAYGQMTHADMFRLCFKSMSYKEFTDALSAGVMSGKLELKQVNGVVYYQYNDQN